MRSIHHLAVAVSVSVLFVLALNPSSAGAASNLHLFQAPALSTDRIAFGYAGDLWTVPREGGRATRLTTGVGIESGPIFSPDGSKIAFTGEFDGNIDVYTIPSTGGIAHRVTYHPAADIAVGWTPDGKKILFRSSRQSVSRYTQLFLVPAQGGDATPLPLPMAYQGELSPDGSQIAYSPFALVSAFDFKTFVSFGDYRGGRASTIWITSLPSLDSKEIPHEKRSDFSPVYCGQQIYFLSGRSGRVGIFRYDPGTRAVTEILHNTGPDIRSLSGHRTTLVYDQMGDIYLYDIATGKSHLVPIEIDADFPEVRPRIKNVADEIQHTSISPTGLRAAIEAHGEILTVPVKHGLTRDITNTPGVMERWPAWSPDGQSIAYFSDESGLYELYIASQTGASQSASQPVRKFPISDEPAYYFDPKWSPNSRYITFHDNRLNIYLLDTTTGKITRLGERNVFGGFSNSTYDLAWSPDSKWIAYPQSLPNHFHALFLYSIDTGKSTQITSDMADSRSPAFDRNGKYLYFMASTNWGPTSDWMEMSSDLYDDVTSNIYAVVLAANQPSPVAPRLDDEKTPATTETYAKGNLESNPPGEVARTDVDAKNTSDPSGPTVPTSLLVPRPVKIDLTGIETRIVSLPLPAGAYTSLVAGTHGSLYLLKRARSGRYFDRAGTLIRWTFQNQKAERLAERVESFELSADGEKMLLGLSVRKPRAVDDTSKESSDHPAWVIVDADKPIKPGEGALSFTDLRVRVDPPAEWAQMYHEVWRIERAYFADPHFHGANTIADERHFEIYLPSIVSRADLNYLFQNMLEVFSIGHLRGGGGDIPAAPHIPGGLLGADYTIHNNRYCLSKIYTGGQFNPAEYAPLAQPGLNLAIGDCILAINGQKLNASMDIQQPLVGTAGQPITLRVASASGGDTRDITVVPIPSEADLRRTDWIDANRRRVTQLSDGKLAYIYLRDTAIDTFHDFNRYYFAQTQKRGAILDERFNGGGQIADYFIEVMSRHIESYWATRYGNVEHMPNGAIYGPKVMIANEFSGSGGDWLAWAFKYAKLGPLVGKRTWGGLVGIMPTPVLMDGGFVTAPSKAFFSPAGKWEIENHGVDPDVVVEQDPKAVSEGHDPQLEMAVSLALHNLEQHPPPQRPEIPTFPNYHR